MTTAAVVRPPRVPTFAERKGTGVGPALTGSMLRSAVPAWAALLVNVMAFLDMPLLVPIPHAMGQAMAQGMLPLALLLALLANPGLVVRPNSFLTLLSLMAVVALMVSVHNEFVAGSTFRAVRFVVFVAVLWLLTPWWGRSDLPLLKAHVAALRVVLGMVLLGAVASPGLAFSFQGRLQGVLMWPIPATQVGHYSAMLLGCTVVLWFCGLVSGRITVVTMVLAGYTLVASHTRTALLAMVIGIGLAGMSLFLGHARVRRTLAIAAGLALAAAAFLGPLLIGWLSRGQTAQEATQLTGRTKVWDAVMSYDRTWVERVFGTGLSNKSFQGLPIDSNWFATYWDSGWFGIGIEIAMLLLLLLIAVARPRGPRRAVALFILAYCVVASFTETGLGDASPYLLELVVAASLLAVPAAAPVPVRAGHPALPRRRRGVPA